jgi:hypothetical protein
LAVDGIGLKKDVVTLAVQQLGLFPVNALMMTLSRLKTYRIAFKQ